MKRERDFFFCFCFCLILIWVFIKRKIDYELIIEYAHIREYEKKVFSMLFESII